VGEDAAPVFNEGNRYNRALMGYVLYPIVIIIYRGLEVRVSIDD
jgi:hypothetical protein